MQSEENNAVRRNSTAALHKTTHHGNRSMHSGYHESFKLSKVLILVQLLYFKTFSLDILQNELICHYAVQFLIIQYLES